MKKIPFILIAILSLTASYLSAHDIKGVDIHGFVSQGYMKSDANNYLAETGDGTFQFNEIGINFSSQISDNLRLGMQLFSRDFGELGNNKISVDWAFGDYKWKDWLGVRAGRIKVAQGLYNETRDLDMVRPFILLPQSVYSELYRDNQTALQGAGVYGDILLQYIGNFSYQLQYGTLDVDDESGPSKIVQDTGILKVIEFDVDSFFSSSLKWETPVNGLVLAGFYNQIEGEANLVTTIPFGESLPAGLPVKMEISDVSVKILSLEYLWRGITISSEYSAIDTSNKVLFNDIMLSEQRTQSEGYYVGASYRFLDWFEFGGYYSVYYPNKDDKNGDMLAAQGKPDHGAWSKDISITCRFDIGTNWIFKLEGHSINGTSMLLSSDNPDGADKNWFMFLAKATFVF